MRLVSLIAAFVIGAMFLSAPATLAGKKKSVESSKAKKDQKWASAVDPKPLSQKVKSGIAWLIKHQQKNGGWAQGEESQAMGGSMDKVR